MYYERLMQIASMTKQAGNANWLFDGLARVGRLFGGKLDKNLTNVEKVLPELRKAVPKGKDAANLRTAYEDAGKAYMPLKQKGTDLKNQITAMDRDFRGRLKDDADALAAYDQFRNYDMPDYFNTTRDPSALFKSVKGLKPEELKAFYDASASLDAMTIPLSTAKSTYLDAARAARGVRRLDSALAQQQKWMDQAALRGGLAVGGAGAAGTAGLGYLLSRGGSTPEQQTY